MYSMSLSTTLLPSENPVLSVTPSWIPQLALLDHYCLGSDSTQFGRFPGPLVHFYGNDIPHALHLWQSFA
jgi:hypothetical protein